MALALHVRGVATRLVLPMDSAQEAALVPSGEVYGARHLLDVVRQFITDADAAAQLPDAAGDGWARVQAASGVAAPLYADLADVKGHTGAKRALEIAAAGGHSLLMVGEPGSGKSMLAQRFAGLLPPMSIDEALESAAVASLGGRFATERWMCRPTAAPHHTASAVALVGGGSPPRPGEISRAHHGVLFLDEFPEFARAALKALREPLETGTITIARAARHAEFPARFQLIAAMNPCPCGYLGAASKACRCTPDQISRYQGKLSGPLLDRIDLHIEVPAVSPQLLLDAPAGESTDSIRTPRGRRARTRDAASGHAQPVAARQCHRQARGPGSLGAPVHVQRREQARMVGTRHAPCAEGGADHCRPGRVRCGADRARGRSGAVPKGAARRRLTRLMLLVVT
jgi:magnesium chelatase family protein